MEYRMIRDSARRRDPTVTNGGTPTVSARQRRDPLVSKTILVVDDDPHIRDVIVYALEKADMNTVVARDGLEALETFRTTGADLIILDINMPEMDGLDVCRELRKSSDVPVLFLSSRDDEIDRIIGLEIGGDDYVTKPFSPRELVARVNVILKRLAPRTPRTPIRKTPSPISAAGWPSTRNATRYSGTRPP